MRSRFFDKTVDDVEAEFLMRLLPPFEPQLDPNFHVVVQKPDRMVKFGLEVVGIDVWTELQFLHPAAGRLVGFVRFGFLVEELAVVNDAADGRRGRSCDFDKIELPIAGQLERGIQGHDAKLLFVVVDDADFASANLAVSAVEWFVTLELSEWGH